MFNLNLASKFSKTIVGDFIDLILVDFRATLLVFLVTFQFLETVD